LGKANPQIYLSINKPFRIKRLCYLDGGMELSLFNLSISDLYLLIFGLFLLWNNLEALFEFKKIRKVYWKGDRLM